MDKVMFDMKGCIQKVLADASKVSLCMDKERTCIVLPNVNCLLFLRSRSSTSSNNSSRLCNIHTMCEMVEEILTEWGNPLDKILAI